MVVQCLKVVLHHERQVQQLKIQVVANRGANNMAKHDDDNRSQQLNPEHYAYWESRGEDGRPDDWQEQLDDE
jgi:hypothetical protein